MNVDTNQIDDKQSKESDNNTEKQKRRKQYFFLSRKKKEKKIWNLKWFHFELFIWIVNFLLCDTRRYNYIDHCHHSPFIVAIEVTHIHMKCV